MLLLAFMASAAAARRKIVAIELAIVKMADR
jgi:hypothetical protein